MSACRNIPQNPQGAAWPLDTESLIEVGGAKTLKIAIYFQKDGVEYRQEKRTAVLNSIKKVDVPSHRETWEHWANVCFTEVMESDKADIRVGFNQSDGSWSYIGRDAKNHDGVTLNLGGINITVPPSEDDFGTILHELGHALGLFHEHQSPLRGTNVTWMIQKQSREYARRVGNQALADDQMTKVVEQSSITNISNFDPDSVMMYQIDGVTERPNNKLSKLDKAFIMLNYPPDLTDYSDTPTKERLGHFQMAIRDAGLEIKAGEILQAFADLRPVLGLPAVEYLTVSHRLQALRQRFRECNKMMQFGSSVISNSMDVSSIKQYALSLRDTPLSLTDPLARQFGLTDPLKNVAKDKFFRSLVKHVVKKALEQRGIPIVGPIPGASSTEVTRMMGAIAAHNEITQHVKAYRDGFQGGSTL